MLASNAAITAPSTKGALLIRQVFRISLESISNARFGAQNGAAEIDQQQNAVRRPNAFDGLADAHRIGTERRRFVPNHNAADRRDGDLAVGHLVGQFFDAMGELMAMGDDDQTDHNGSLQILLFHPIKCAFDSLFPACIARIAGLFVDLAACQVRSTCQLARRLSRSLQNPTARPAA